MVFPACSLSGANVTKMIVEVEDLAVSGIYIYIYMYIYVCMYMMHVHASSRINMHVFMHVHTHMYVCNAYVSISHINKKPLTANVFMYVCDPLHVLKNS
jgi:hypothetical protein